MGEGGVKNPEKLPTSFMDGPYVWQCMSGYPNLKLQNYWQNVSHFTLHLKKEFAYITLEHSEK